MDDRGEAGGPIAQGICQKDGNQHMEARIQSVEAINSQRPREDKEETAPEKQAAEDQPQKIDKNHEPKLGRAKKLPTEISEVDLREVKAPNLQASLL